MRSRIVDGQANYHHRCDMITLAAPGSEYMRLGKPQPPQGCASARTDPATVSVRMIRRLRRPPKIPSMSDNDKAVRRSLISRYRQST